MAKKLLLAVSDNRGPDRFRLRFDENPEEEDLSDADIPRGQRKLLLHAVRNTFPGGAVAREQSTATSCIDCEQPTAEDAGQPLDTGIDGKDQGQWGSYSNLCKLLWPHQIRKVCIHGKIRKFI